MNEITITTFDWVPEAPRGYVRDIRLRWALDGFLTARLGHVETYLSDREWLTDAFSIADIIMSDVLRLADRFDALAEYPNCRTYVERATSRPAFKKAYQDQLDHFAMAD